MTRINYNCIYSMKIYMKRRDVEFFIHCIIYVCRNYADFAVRVSDLKHTYLGIFVQFVSGCASRRCFAPQKYHCSQVTNIAASCYIVKLAMLLSVPTGNKLPRLYRIYVLQPAVTAARVTWSLANNGYNLT